MQQLQEELEMMKQSELSVQELQWSSHLMTLTEDHNQFFRDAKVVVFKVMQDAQATDELNVCVLVSDTLFRLNSVRSKSAFVLIVYFGIWLKCTVKTVFQFYIQSKHF